MFQLLSWLSALPLRGHLQATSPPTTDPHLSLKKKPKKKKKKKKYIHSSTFSSTQTSTAEVEIVSSHLLIQSALLVEKNKSPKTWNTHTESVVWLFSIYKIGA